MCFSTKFWQIQKTKKKHQSYNNAKTKKRKMRKNNNKTSVSIGKNVPLKNTPGFSAPDRSAWWPSPQTLPQGLWGLWPATRSPRSDINIKNWHQKKVKQLWRYTNILNYKFVFLKEFVCFIHDNSLFKRATWFPFESWPPHLALFFTFGLQLVRKNSVHLPFDGRVLWRHRYPPASSGVHLANQSTHGIFACLFIQNTLILFHIQIKFEESSNQSTKSWNNFSHPRYTNWLQVLRFKWLFSDLPICHQ